jgi:hypothetical protein
MNNSYLQPTGNSRRESLTSPPLFQRQQDESARTQRRSSLVFSSLFQATFNASLNGSTYFDGELDVSNNSNNFPDLKESTTTIKNADLRLRFIADQAANRSILDIPEYSQTKQAESELVSNHTYKHSSLHLRNMSTYQRQVESIPIESIVSMYRGKYAPN